MRDLHRSAHNRVRAGMKTANETANHGGGDTDSRAIVLAINGVTDVLLMIHATMVGEAGHK